jgi:hypothetical protein
MGGVIISITATEVNDFDPYRDRKETSNNRF